uniref:Copper homeostasis protein cutC homolog n=1 Tax=Eutreptiella gymnastica TaxID=73025 RepID=A0A7S4GI21_9EUGL
MPFVNVEVCVDSVQSALNACCGGAHRIELCGDLVVGGTTPSLGLVKKVLQCTRQWAMQMLQPAPQVFAMIRPRAGDFLYSESEIEVMVEDITAFRDVPVDGVVFGVLTAEGAVDTKAMQRLMAAAAPLPVTFHRAIDMSCCLLTALETCITLGVANVLTSGGESTAEKGAAVLKQLVEKSAGRIAVMAGCGVNASNVAKIVQQSGVQQVHLSGRIEQDSGMIWRNAAVAMGAADAWEYKIYVCSQSKVRAVVDTLGHLIIS